MPRRGFGPIFAMTGEKEGVLATTGWERDGRVEVVMVWRCPVSMLSLRATGGVAIQSGWYRRSGERSRGCPCVRWIAASGLRPSSQ